MEYFVPFIILIISSGILYFYWTYSYFARLGIPYVKPWPIFGNMGEVTFAVQSLFDKMIDIYNYNREAKYIGIYNFSSPLILIRDPEVIKDISITNHESFMNHTFVSEEKVDADPRYNMLGFMRDKQWRELRNLLSPAFNSMKIKAVYKMMVPIIEYYMQFMDDLPDHKRYLFDSKDFFSRLSHDIGAKHDFGVSIDSLKYPDNEFYVRSERAFNVQNSFSLKLRLIRQFPWITKYLGLKGFSDETTDFYRRIMEKTINMRKEEGSERCDLVQLMMEAQKKCRMVELDLYNMTAQSMGFLAGNIDNVSSQICLLLHELALNTGVQCRLQEEIDKVRLEFGDMSEIPQEAISTMPYLDAVINETNRLRSLAASLSRTCNRSYELPPSLPGLKPHTLKPGDTVWISVSGIHSDSKYYEEPNKFNPDRYLGKKITFNDPLNLLFGIGPRHCIGAKFAILQAKTIIFHLLSKFNVRKSIKTDDPFIPSARTLATAPKSGFWIKIEKRS